MKKRKGYEPKAGGKFETSVAMASMREIAFGQKTRSHIWNTMDRSEKMRDDDAMLKAAEEKRLRKMAKRAGK